MKFPGSSATSIEMIELDFVPGAAFARAPEQLGYTAPCLSGTNEEQPQGSREGRRMSERDIDQQLVERAQQGDKHAFELLVSKYQRKLGRLLSRFIRDPGEVKDYVEAVEVLDPNANALVHGLNAEKLIPNIKERMAKRRK